jgi:hypothetical protein
MLHHLLMLHLLAGKYVPSLSHYILQVDALAHGYYDQLHVSEH